MPASCGGSGEPRRRQAGTRNILWSSTLTVDADEAGADADGGAAEVAGPGETRRADAGLDSVELVRNTQTISSQGRLRQNLDLKMLYWPAQQR